MNLFGAVFNNQDLKSPPSGPETALSSKVAPVEQGTWWVDWCRSRQSDKCLSPRVFSALKIRISTMCILTNTLCCPPPTPAAWETSGWVGELSWCLFGESCLAVGALNSCNFLLCCWPGALPVPVPVYIRDNSVDHSTYNQAHYCSSNGHSVNWRCCHLPPLQCLGVKYVGVALCPE